MPDLFGYDQPALCTTIEGHLPNSLSDASSWGNKILSYEKR